ncbi:hypothetical protein F5Y18DRAFT_396733 [Xylariaceae sp. FL1019]|nr:hypothetical protein F5Y18DRAFT_396733 [Xylariaceae sp. FL1019]
MYGCTAEKLWRCSLSIALAFPATPGEPGYSPVDASPRLPVPLGFGLSDTREQVTAHSSMQVSFLSLRAQIASLPCLSAPKPIAPFSALFDPSNYCWHMFDMPSSGFSQVRLVLGYKIENLLVL